MQYICWVFALCGHLGAAPQHVSIRMRADLAFPFQYIQQQALSFLSNKLNAWHFLLQLHTSAILLQWRTIKSILYLLLWASFSETLRETSRFFYGDCVSFWALHLQNKCLLNSCICSVKINNSVTLLSACRLSCHKKCEVKVRDGSSFTPYHKWIITCLHDLCTIQYVYMATRAQHSSAFMQIHTVFTYCEDT